MPKLTIVQKQNIQEIVFEGTPKVSELLQEEGGVPHLCGGRGVCRKCKVEIEGALSPLTQAEKTAGSRLSCQTVLLGDATLILPESEEMQIEGGDGTVTWNSTAERLGACVDIGTTTIVLQVYDLGTGQAVAEATAINPQRSVSADVMGRIDAALNGKAELLRRLIVTKIEGLLRQAADLERIEKLVICGNTTMLYLLTGRDVKSLATSPFRAEELFDKTDVLFGKQVYFPPCISAFVGADITCALLAADILDSEETVMLCDIGTNGELVLYRGGSFKATSTAAGPAFEGAGISCGSGGRRGAIDRVWVENGVLRCQTIGNEKAVGICGSGLIDAVASALEMGLVDETGMMERDIKLAEGVTLVQEDIRALQLAKAAIAAGVQALLCTMGCSEQDVERCLIAGGFGKHLDAARVSAIGLLPKEWQYRQTSIGNAALRGAAILLTDPDAKVKIRRIAALSQVVELGGSPVFNEAYIENMMFKLD